LAGLRYEIENIPITANTDCENCTLHCHQIIAFWLWVISQWNWFTLCIQGETIFKITLTIGQVCHLLKRPEKCMWPPQ